MPILTEPARAKINLYLHVRGKRADGYHDLDSLVVFAEYGDALTLEPGRPLSFAVSGPFAEAIEGPNLVEKAVMMARAASPALELGAFHLEKRLPVAAGIGGGSADAAAALRLLQQASGTPFDAGAIAASLGSDVPVCLAGRAAMVTGRGTEVEPLPYSLPAVPIVLANPGVPLSTPAVFKALGAGPSHPSAGRDPARARGPFADVRELAQQLAATRNDLGPPAIRLVPAIADVLAALRAEPGCLLARLSGSGPTCFALCESDAAADRISERLQAAHENWWVQATRLMR